MISIDNSRSACRSNSSSGAVAGVLVMALLLGNPSGIRADSTGPAPSVPFIAPDIQVYQPQGVQSGDVTISYVISDTELDAIGLLVEYSTDGGTTWNAATVTGDTTGILVGAYSGTITWNSGIDLPNQDASDVEIRITPSDAGTGNGTPETVTIDIDNTAPTSISAFGNSGSTTLQFWFNERVSESTAADTANISLSGGLQDTSIAVVEEWTQEAITVPALKRYAGVGELDGKLYIVGGNDTNTGANLSTIQIYDPASDSWSAAANMPTVRRSPIVAGINGKLYVAGGWNGTDVAALDIYDPSANTWTSSAAPGFGDVWDVQGAVLNGKWYINEDTGTIHIYDPTTNAWSTTTGGVARPGVAVAAINGKFYIAGGSSYSNQLTEYDPSTGFNTAKAIMPTGRHSTIFGVIDGKFYVAGGPTGSIDNILEVYDPVTDTWRTATTAPGGHGNAYGTVVNGKLYFGREITGSSGYTVITFDVFDWNKLELTLSGGARVPPPPNTVTITVNNITDRAGNAITGSLQNTFTPSSGNVPTIALYHPEGPQRGDVTIEHVITDDENNPVWLLAEYQLPGQSTWNAATITGDTTDIQQANYTANLVWKTATDIPNAEYDNVEFRVKIRDNGTSWGGSDSAFIDIDNTPPAWVEAEGNSGDTEFYFWFDEAVTEASATNTSNISLSGGGLTISSIDVDEDWTVQPISVPAVKRDPGVGELDGLLYVVGGYGSGSYSNTVQVYDPDNDTWSTTAPMPVIDGLSGRSNPVVIGLNGKLYVIGGYYSGNRSWTTIYDPDNDSWTRLADAPYTLTTYQAQGGVIKGKIYLNDDSGRILVYDPNTDTWENRTGGWSSSGIAAAIINDKLYMAGGTAGTDDACFVYDPVSGLAPLTNMPNPRYNAVGAAIAGKFYVFGGNNNNVELSTVDVYDPGSDTWTTVTAGPTVSQEHRGALVDGVFYFGIESGETAWFDTYDRTSFVATLGANQTMPAPPVSYTLSASNIVDLVGNTTTATLDTSFTSSTGGAPTIALYQPTGTRTGDITIPHVITDAEDNPVWLKVEYSTDGGATWQAATGTGEIDSITTAGYSANLVWNTGTDLNNQEFNDVELRVSAKDGETWNAEDTILIDVDNKAPSTITADGNSGDSNLTFWFNENVDVTTATNTSNITLSGGLTVSNIQVNDEWSDGAITVPDTRYQVGAAELDGKLYVVGGHNDSDGNQRSSLEVYDPDTDSWTTKASMPTARRNPMVVGLNGMLYVMIGWNNQTGNQDNLIVYDPDTDSWTTKSATPFSGENNNGSAAAVNGKIYVFWWDIVYVYDPPTDTWTNFSTGQLGRDRIELAVIDSLVYVIGGYRSGDLSDLWKIDTVTNQTTVLTSMNIARYQTVAGVIGGKIYVTGGYGNGWRYEIEIYDPATDSWSTGLSARDGGLGTDYSGDVVDGKIYFGRQVSGGNSTTTTYDVYSRDSFELTLGTGETVPAPPDSVTITASSITDWTGNTVSGSINNFFVASTGTVPSIAIYQPSGMQGGDATIRFKIADTESNPVWLLAEYQLPGTSTWNPATVTGDTTAIPSGLYTGTLTWNSGTDLPGQEVYSVVFRLTVRDNPASWGGSDTAWIDVDNKPPQYIEADGISGGSSLWFWFDEPVTDSTATTTGNLTVTGSTYTTNSIAVSDEWTQGAALLPSQRVDVATAVFEGELYVIGGWDNLSWTAVSTLEKYDPDTGNWTTLTSMPTARKSSVAGVINGQIYVVGGYNDSFGDLNVLEVYNPATDSWTAKQIAPFNGSTDNRIQGEAVNGKLHVNYSSGEIYIYDPHTNSWEMVSSAGLPHEGVSTAVFDEKLYIAGGWLWPNHRGDLLVFDPDTRVTTALTGMPTGRRDAVIGVFDDRLYVVGGNTDPGETNVVEIYDTSTDTWTTGLPAPDPDSRFFGEVAGGKLYAGRRSNDGNSFVFDSYSRSDYELTLATAEILPAPPNTIRVSASNISDWYGNTIAAAVDSAFTPDTGQAPAIAVYQPTGTQGGDATVNYLVKDTESNPVWLMAEYQLEGTGVWNTATVTGDTSGITSAGYAGSLVWNTGADLPNQEVSRVSFRVTVRDNGLSWGGSDTALLNVDNQAPQWIKADGSSGEPRLWFWFDEPVTAASATATGNLTVTGSVYTSASIAPIEEWVAEDFRTPGYRLSAGSAVLDGKWYVVGGWDNTIWDEVGTLEAYDPSTKTWSTLAGMPTPRSDMVVAAINGKLYVVGGYNDGHRSEVEIYDPVTDTWTQKQPAPFTGHTRDDIHGSAINGKLYIYDTYDGIYVYDPQTDSWQVSTTNLRYTQFSTFAYNDLLYIIGGWDNNLGQYSGDLWVYDPVSGSMTQKTSMSVPRSRPVTGIMDGRIYIVGGRDNNDRLDVEIYDPGLDTWTTGTMLPNGGDESVGAVIDGKLYYGHSLNDQTSNYLSFHTLSSQTFELTLGTGENLPAPPNAIRVAAAGISDWLGNTLTASIDTSFVPSSGQAPDITIYTPTGTRSGDVSIYHKVTDNESNPVWMLAEYQLPGETTWNAASVTGDTAAVYSTGYDAVLTWNSGTDLPDQQIRRIRFRLTVRDNETTWGGSDTVLINVDNQAPQSITAEGISGSSSFRFKFNEVVTDASATNTANFSLSAGLTVSSINVIEEWTSDALMLPSAKSEFGVSKLDGQIYFVGGYKDGNALSTVDVYDPDSDTWTTVSDIPSPRQDPILVGLNGLLYVVGGVDQYGNYQAGMFIYDPDTLSWTSKSAPSFGRGNDFVGAAIQGMMYVYDPWNGMNEYDPKTDTWSNFSIGIDYYGMASAVIGGKLYMAGGWTDNGWYYHAGLEVFDPETRTLDRSRASMFTERQNAVGGAVNGKFYVVGGNNYSGDLDVVEIYDPSTNTWTTGIPAPHQSSLQRGIRQGGKFYFQRGWFTTGFGDQAVFDVYSRDNFDLTLGAGETLPSPPTSVTITANSISDRRGNVSATALATSFVPSSGDPPTIKVISPTGVQSGDVAVNYSIADNEGNPVWMRAEYRLWNQTLWNAATVTGDTSGIVSSGYNGTITWNSGSDLTDLRRRRVRFRLTVRDNQTSWGGSDTVLLDIDNKPPAAVYARGDVGSTTFEYWFNEPVTEATATNTANISLTGGLTPGSSVAIEAWATQPVNDPNFREQVGIGVLDGKLYVVGGWSDQSNSEVNTVERYNPRTGIWETLTPMPSPRQDPQVAALNGLLYVLGGDDLNGTVSRMEVYDPETDSWSSAASPYFGVSGGQIAMEALGGMLYVNGDNDQMYYYDPDTNTWGEFTGGMPHSWVTTTVIDGKMYIAGGWNNIYGYYSNELTVFDPVSRVTTYLQGMNMVRQDAVGGTIDGKFFVAGGWDGGSSLNSIEYYDPALNTWTSSSTIVPRDWWSSPLGTAIGGRLYFGGPEWSDSAQSDFMSFDVYLRDGFEMTLGGGQVLPFERITVSATGIEDWNGNISGSISGEFVPDDGNANPTIVINNITGEVSGDVSIGYTVSDFEGDPFTLAPEYSIDGRNTWNSATVSAAGGATPPADQSGSQRVDTAGGLTWHSKTDLPNFELVDIWFRITVTDNTVEFGNLDQITFHLDNNEVPTASITSVAYTRTDTTGTFNYQLSDAESDTLSLLAEFSTDGGNIWSSATTSSTIANIDTSLYTGSIVWNLETDLPQAVMEVLFRITPSDRDAGISDQKNVQLNAVGVPSVTIDSTYTDEQNGDVLIPFTIVDDEGDVVSLTAEYLDIGGLWQTATVTGTIISLGPGSYVGTLTWNSLSDLDGQDMANAGFKLTPADANSGFDDEAYFHLDNNDIPAVSIGTPSGYQYRDVTFNYNISDTEGDAIGLMALYSTDGGTNWAGMDVTGSDTTAIGSANYSGQLTWHCFDDMGYGEWTSVMVKLLPHDLDAGTEGSTTTFTIENYVGDYSADGAVSSADFATLVYAYNSQDLYHDIGPATGTVPLLMPVFDNVIDFEDLAVFIQMWNWSLGIAAQQAEEGPRSLVKPTASERQNRNHSVLLQEKLSDDPWAADNGVMDLELKASQVSGVMVTSLELTYDPEHLKFLSMEPGTFMGRPSGSKQSLIHLQNVDEEKGRLSLLLGRIDAVDPDVSGSGLLAGLHFAKLSKENSIITVAYEMWDRDAELLVQDSYKAEVHALRIPGEFALLQNYPNPFNGETVIRFQLPQAARVQMYVFNIRGQRVAKLIDEQMDPGYHKITWDGRNDDNRKVASGIYIYLIQANRNRASQKLTIIK